LNFIILGIFKFWILTSSSHWVSFILIVELIIEEWLYLCNFTIFNSKIIALNYLYSYQLLSISVINSAFNKSILYSPHVFIVILFSEMPYNFWQWLSHSHFNSKFTNQLIRNSIRREYLNLFLDYRWLHWKFLHYIFSLNNMSQLNLSST